MHQQSKPPRESLAEQVESLERQVARVADLLESQLATTQNAAQRRWRPSLRTYFVLMALLAAFIAWFGVEFRRSRQQARAVDLLLAEQASLLFETNESLGVSILPGPPGEPPAFLMRSLGYDFFFRLGDVSVDGARVAADSATVLDAIEQLPQLRRLRIRNILLTTDNLKPIFELNGLESLDLSKTRLSDSSIAWICDTHLRWLNVSHTWLGDTAVNEIATLDKLQYLNLERTGVSDRSIDALSEMRGLRHLIIRRTSITAAGAKQLSKNLPNCFIEYQPLIFRSNGTVDYTACQKGTINFGKPIIADPRVNQAVRPPADYSTGPYAIPAYGQPSGGGFF